MIIDGRALAREVLIRTNARAAALSHSPRVLAIVANETPATRSYLSIKEKRAADAGCVLIIERFLDSVTAEELMNAISRSDADAIIVQLPLPASIDTKRVCNAIPVGKDADVLSEDGRERFERGAETACLPPVAGAVAEVLRASGVEVAQKKAAVIGRGFLVGAPVAVWLARARAQVTVVNRSTPDFSDILRGADIIVSGAGSPHLIKPDLIKEGAVLIDAGTSESGGTIVGDIDPACASAASLFTPVPGGIGPLAVAKLFENAVALASVRS